MRSYHLPNLKELCLLLEGVKINEVEVLKFPSNTQDEWDAPLTYALLLLALNDSHCKKNQM